MKKRKGTMALGDVPGVAMIFIFAAVIFVAGFLVLENLQTDQYTNTAGCNSTDKTGCSAAYNSTLVTIDAIENTVDYADTWGTIIGVAVLLGIVVFGFGMARRQGYI